MVQNNELLLLYMLHLNRYLLGAKLMNIPHPIPYQGSKRCIAREIIAYFPNNVERLIEPFAGSAAVSLAAACHQKAYSFWLNDINEPLANLWSGIINRPEEVANAYRKLWEEQEGKERAYYDLMRQQFNATQHPEYLLYLLARCVKAAVRYNSNGEFNQSPDNRRRGTRPATMKAQIVGASAILRGRTSITSYDFHDVLTQVTPADLVYMDPPYQGVYSSHDHRYLGSIDYKSFVASLEELNANGVSFIISYDGGTGTKKFGKALPDPLNLVHKEIKAGKSSQATLLGHNEDTYESLYLSPALIKRLGRAERVEEQLLLPAIHGEETEPTTKISETIGSR